MEDTLKPLCPPYWLHPNQWASFEAAGYDMRHAKLVQPMPVIATARKRS